MGDIKTDKSEDIEEGGFEGIIPEFNKEDIELINHIQNNTPVSVLYKKYGHRKRYFDLRKKIIEKYKISFELNIKYEKFGLNRYFILSKFCFDSPYLVQYIPYYLPTKQFLSQFTIPLKFERKFINLIVKLDPEVELYRGEELGPPQYCFLNYSLDIPHEKRFYNWMRLIMEGKVPDLQIPDHSLIEFDSNMLKILHYIVKGFPREKIMEEMGIERRRKYDTPVKKMKTNIFQEVLSIPTISKLLYIIDKSGKVDLSILAKSFQELFLFCHPFQISKMYPPPKGAKDFGILCQLTPPTPHIPLFHHTIDNFLERDSFLALLGEPTDSFNLNKVYDESKKNWIWDDNTVQILE